jgi:hypothetical protein
MVSVAIILVNKGMKNVLGKVVNASGIRSFARKSSIMVKN